LLSSQEYHYEAGLTEFMQNYLGVESMEDDAIELDPVGNDSHPIGHGLGPYEMVRPDDWEVYWPQDEYEGPYDDYAYANPGAAEPFRFNASGQSNSTNYDSGTFRSVFLAWPFEWIDTVEERAEIMEASLGWMCSAGLGNLNLIPPIQSDSGIPGETVPYTLTLVNNVGFVETFTITYESDWPLDGPVTVGPIAHGSSEVFEVEMMVPEEANCYETDSGVITAIAQSDPELSASAYVTTSALPDGVGNLAGTVYDANTGLGIPQAYVFVELASDYFETWTDDDGDYGMTDMPACTFNAGFNAMGYYNQFDVPVEINDGLTTTQDAYLAAALPELSADSISIHVPEDSVGEYTLVISNDGTGDLHFHISDITPESIYPTADERPVIPNGIDEELFAALNSYPGATEKFIVYFKEQADLTPAYSIQDRYARGQYVLNALRAVANSSQAELAAELNHQGVAFESRYIVNAMEVTGNLQLVNQIAAHAEVAYIGVNRQVPAPEPVEMSPLDGDISVLAWNIAQVNADDVWSEYGVTGAGIVVSNIDTGVQYDHPALVNQYRGNLGAGTFDHNYNWWDPYGDQPMAPYDYHAHGSHTIGTMVGDDGFEQHIGMAPDGQWIACNGFKQGGSGYTAELLECAEFILAPWDLAGENPNPDLRPDIVNNSWGGGQADWWYNQAIYAWRAAGIFPVFSNGNAGPECSTTGAPDYANVMAVGATNSLDMIAGFSSRGPALITEITKPDVAAPGVSVYSAYNNGGYGTMSGTSMAAPHVGGQAALIWSAVPELRGDVQLTYWIIEQSALPILDGQCGDPNPPNNVYGWGRIDAYEAVGLALDSSWETPWLTVDPVMGVVLPDEALRSC
jgi:subtilisin family serine protease